MAQDNRPQQQAVQSRPPQQSVVSPLSPFYSKDSLPPAPVSQQSLWLFERGWRCIGDPAWPTAQWFDSTRPLKTESHEEPKFGYVERLNRSKKDANGKPTLEWSYEQLYDQDGSDRGNRTVPITQTVIVPPATPMTMQEAILVQLNRDQRTADEAAKQKVA